MDLYLTYTHTANGLADALYEVSEFLESDPFVAAARGVRNAWIAGVAGHGQELRREHLKNFAKAITGVDRPIIFVLDTAERLVYGLPTLPEALRGEVATAWNWLLDLLSAQMHVRLLLAGRAPSAPLADMLKERLGANSVASHVLETLATDEVLEYFDAVAGTLRAQGAAFEDPAQKEDLEELAARVAVIDSRTRRLAADWSQGVPIRLALMVDYLILGGAIPDLASEPEAWDGKFIERLRAHPETYDTVLALGPTPKGVDAPLLATLLQIEEGEASRRLVDIARLSFVKWLDVPGVGERVFLHDEMYDLLQREVFGPPNVDSDRVEAQRTIELHYKQLMQRWSSEYLKLYEPIERGEVVRNGKDADELLQRIVDMHQKRHALLVEDTHYALRRELNSGFRRRYRYTRDATLSGDIGLDYALQAELLSYIGERDPEGKGADLNGIGRNQILGVIAMRPAVRAWIEARYEDVLELAGQTRAELTELFEDDLNCAIMDTWEAYASIYLGNTAAAVEALKHALEEAHAAQNKDGVAESYQWRAKAIEAFAQRVLGYAYRTQGRLRDAVAHYRKSSQLWRSLNLKAEIATVHNDEGFALAELGDLHIAEDLVEDGLGLRRELGSRARVGLSLNTLAHVQMRQGNNRAARENAEKALRLFEWLEYDRGRGLARIVLAEASRREIGAREGVGPQARISELEQVLVHAQEAHDIFERTGERSRQVEALIEIGCNLRDQVHWHRVLSNQISGGPDD